MTENFVSPVVEKITKSSDQVTMRLNLQLDKEISRVFQKLLKYFNDGAILSSFKLPFTGIFRVIQILDLNDLEFKIAGAGTFQ